MPTPKCAHDYYNFLCKYKMYWRKSQIELFDPDILIIISLSPTEARDGFHRLMRDNVNPRAQRLISGTINIT